MTNPLHTYRYVDVPGTEDIRWVVLDVSETFNRANGDEGVIAKEVWSGRPVYFYDADEVSRGRREAFEECRKRNGGRPRRARFSEAISLMAELKAMNDAERASL